MTKLIKVIKYKGTCIKVYDNGTDCFQYEYSFVQDGKVVRDRTSHSTIKSCIKMAKVDYDMEELCQRLATP